MKEKVCLAKSLAGHDKDRIYVVLEETETAVFVADGALRKVENPKKKNRRHVQLIKRLPKEVEELLLSPKLENVHVKRAIKTYQAHI